MKTRILLPTSLAFAGGFVSGLLFSAEFRKQSQTVVHRVGERLRHAAEHAFSDVESRYFSCFPEKPVKWDLSDAEVMATLR